MLQLQRLCENFWTHVVELEELRRILGRSHASSTRFDVSLDAVSRWRVGGVATAVIEPASTEEVADVLALMHERPEPLVVIGDTSNVLFDSAGFNGVLLRIGQQLSKISIDGTRVTAQAGITVPSLARLAADHGLAGLEHTVGIPGTLGGLVVMNGGSQRKGIGSNVVEVGSLSRSGAPSRFDNQACNFGYRSSVFQATDSVVVEVDLELTAGDSPTIHREMDKVIESRRSRFPESEPNCGSTFVSDPEMYDLIGPPGRAIEQAGLKGFRIGDAQVSTQHANFVVNVGRATSQDVLDVIQHIRSTVFRRTGFAMSCEVRHISPDGRVRAAHLSQTESGE